MHKLVLRYPDELHEKLRLIAFKNHRSINREVLTALTQWIQINLSDNDMSIDYLSASYYEGLEEGKKSCEGMEERIYSRLLEKLSPVLLSERLIV